jgi:hypothetical protein
MKIPTAPLGSRRVRPIPPLSQSRQGDMACQALYVRKHAQGATQHTSHEHLASVCELTRRLGSNDAKTKTQIGQSAGQLTGLEREPLNELDNQPGRKSGRNGDNGHQGQPNKETSHTLQTTSSSPCNGARADGSAQLGGGFLF